MTDRVPPASHAQSLRYVQDVSALVMTRWPHADTVEKRALVERLRNQTAAALLELETDLLEAEAAAHA